MHARIHRLSFSATMLEPAVVPKGIDANVSPPPLPLPAFRFAAK